ncbi:MAG: hypothetical protein AB1714_16560 [Acidobacteriota bacterium]
MANVPARRILLGSLVGIIFGLIACLLVRSDSGEFVLPLDQDLPPGSSGFYDSEGGARWTGRRASLALPGLPRRRQWQCELLLRAYCPDPAACPSVSITVDEKSVATGEVDGKDRTFKLTIPPDPRRAGATLGIQCSKTFVPGPHDSRELGAVLSKVVLRRLPERTGLGSTPGLAAALLLAASLGAGACLAIPRLPWAVLCAAILSVAAARAATRAGGPFEAPAEMSAGPAAFASLMVLLVAASVNWAWARSDARDGETVWTLRGLLLRHAPAVICMAGCLMLGLQLGAPYRLAIGSGEDRYVHGWRGDDENVLEDHARRYYRWALDGCSLRLPLRFLHTDVALSLVAARHAPGEVTVAANSTRVFRQSFDRPAPWRNYTVIIPNDVASRGALHLRFSATPQDPELLVLAVDSIQLLPGRSGLVIPTLGLLLSFVAAAVTFNLAAGRFLGLGKVLTAQLIVSAAVLAGLLFWKLPTITIVSRFWPFLLFLWAVSLIIPGIVRDRSWAAVLFLGLVLHGVLYFHPYHYPADLHYHSRFAQRLGGLSLAQIYDVSLMYDVKGEGGLTYPYSPVFHLIAGSICPAGGDIKYVVKFLMLAVFGLVGVCLRPICRRLGLGVIPLALYLLDPTLMRYLYLCFAPTVFGLALFACIVLFIGTRHLADLGRAPLLGVTLLAAFAMCAYPATFVQLSLFLGLLGAWAAFDRDTRPELPALALILTLSVAVAMVVFYGHYADLLLRFVHESRDKTLGHGSAPSFGAALRTFVGTLVASRSWPFIAVAAMGAVLSLKRRDQPRWRATQLVWFATFLGMIVLTSDYLLPSVRGHIKEMAYFCPLLVMWEAECIVWFHRRGYILFRITSVTACCMLIVLSIAAVYRLLSWSFVF